MRADIAKALARYPNPSHREKAAMAALAEPDSRSSESEAAVNSDSFCSIYSGRASSLSRSGVITDGFPELLAAVRNSGMPVVLVSLLEQVHQKILIVRRQDGDVIGCATFAVPSDVEQPGVPSDVSETPGSTDPGEGEA